jgi:hypothetical protein
LLILTNAIMVASKYFGAWRNLLMHVFKRKESRLTNFFHGRKLGIDVATWLQNDVQLHRDFAYGMGWRFQHYQPARIVEMFHRRHERLLAFNITPVYVFPGRPNPQRLFRNREMNALEKIRDFYRQSRQQRIFSTTLQKTLVASNLHLCHMVHPQLCVFLAAWLKDTLGVPAENIINAPFETPYQLRELERTGVTIGSISNDITLAMIGSERMLVFCNFPGPNRIYYRKFYQDKDIDLKKYQHDFRGLSEYLPEALTFFESDYWQRHQTSVKDSLKKNFPNYVIDHQRWLMNGGTFSDYMYPDPHNPPPMDIDFVRAANQLRYGPVVRSSATMSAEDGGSDVGGGGSVITTNYTIEPLNPLPDGLSWKDAIGFDPITDVYHDIAPADYGDAMHFENCRSFIMPPPSQPSLVPGFDEMKAIMPKKPRRLSFRERKKVKSAWNLEQQKAAKEAKLERLRAEQERSLAASGGSGDVDADGGGGEKYNKDSADASDDDDDNQDGDDDDTSESARDKDADDSGNDVDDEAFSDEDDNDYDLGDDDAYDTYADEDKVEKKKKGPAPPW